MCEECEAEAEAAADAGGTIDILEEREWLAGVLNDAGLFVIGQGMDFATGTADIVYQNDETPSCRIEIRLRKMPA